MGEQSNIRHQRLCLFEIFDGFGGGLGHVRGVEVFGFEFSPFQNPAGPVSVELFLPSPDNDRCDAVANHIGHSPCLGHEPVHAKNEDHAFNGNGFHGGQGGGQGDEGAANDSSRSLGSNEANDQNGQFLSKGNVSIGGLSDKEG